MCLLAGFDGFNDDEEVVEGSNHRTSFAQSSSVYFRRTGGGVGTEENLRWERWSDWDIRETAVEIMEDECTAERGAVFDETGMVNDGLSLTGSGCERGFTAMLSSISSGDTPSMSSTGTFLCSSLSLAADRESSEVGVVEIEPSSESFEEVDEVDSR